MNKKIQNLITKTSMGLIEREEIVRLTYLALLGGESIFLLGPPGVAKSLLARRMKDVLDDGSEFEYLMNKFSTPEEIFGPISLSKLDEDKYERNINGYLPTSDIVFLDEIWKASPSIQNTLLTVINEKLFRNGDSDLEVPLKLLLAASNELPAEGEGLEALYDRFLIRMYVNNTKTEEGFNSLITSHGMDDYSIESSEKITTKELDKIKLKSKGVKVPLNILKFINLFRKRLGVELGEHAPYISDRRWKKIIGLLKTSAYISGRKNISPSDALLIKEMIWETEKQIPLINNVFKGEYRDLLISYEQSSLAKIQISFDRVNELVKSGYVTGKKLLTKNKQTRNGTIERHVCFEGTQNGKVQYFFIPESVYESFKTSTTNHIGRQYISLYYAAKSGSTTLHKTSEYTNNFAYDSETKTLRYSSWTLIEYTKTTKKTDKKKLQAAKDILDSMIIDITNIKKDVTKKIDIIKQEDSTLIFGHDLEIELASLEIEKILKSFISQHSDLLGQIVPHIKSSEE